MVYAIGAYKALCMMVYAIGGYTALCMMVYLFVYFIVRVNQVGHAHEN
jgi:hypothetical protein